jgi:hypothetical protein
MTCLELFYTGNSCYNQLTAVAGKRSKGKNLVYRNCKNYNAKQIKNADHRSMLKNDLH